MKNFLFLSILFLGLGLTSCKDDEMHNHDNNAEYNVTVTIVSPEGDSTHALNEAVHIHITMVHEHLETIHNALIQVKNAEDEVVMTLLDDHIHEEDGDYEFHSMDFVPDVAGTYTINAMTTNHDGALPQHAHAEFTVE